MIELSEHPDGRITRAFGGDTLNTAVYLARSGVVVDYVTALGDDGWSDEMLAFWAGEGVGTGMVQRLVNRVPGLYIIQTDAKGERRFSYWRDRAPARELFSLPQTDAVCDALAGYDQVYLSGISLSLYGDDGRAVLFRALDQVKARGGRIAFDTNYRPRGWPDRAQGQAAYGDAMQRADLIFASVEDLHGLYGGDAAAAISPFLAGKEVVLKLDEPACRVMVDGRDTRIDAPPVAHVVDTTAAGDSFAAAYMAARLSGQSPDDAARAGHRLAGAVVQHRGAIIPLSAMPGRA
jgi:2-dehydro-3-deoxygluconokinase